MDAAKDVRQLLNWWLSKCNNPEQEWKWDILLVLEVQESMFNMTEDTENLPNPADLSQIPSHRGGRETTNMFQEQFRGFFILSEHSDR